VAGAPLYRVKIASRMTRVAEQMARRRERILEAAREIVAERGFEGLTVRALADAAGVTAPTIYNLVGSKDQVLVAAVAEQTERFLAGIERAEGDVLAVVDANLRELLRMPRYYRSLLRLMMLSDAAEPARRNVAAALGGQIRSALGELAEEGAVEDWVDLDALTGQLGALLWAASLRWANGWISDAAFEREERLGVAYVLVGATRGPAREALLHVVRDLQPGGRRARRANVALLARRR